ncbi:MAG: hypothetical protein HY703_06410 [Gemmatimonadetes bacterium]|nr:hypothetical protein [Gemmatimonadota bacterium]
MSENLEIFRLTERTAYPTLEFVLRKMQLLAHSVQQTVVDGPVFLPARQLGVDWLRLALMLEKIDVVITLRLQCKALRLKRPLDFSPLLRHPASQRTYSEITESKCFWIERRDGQLQKRFRQLPGLGQKVLLGLQKTTTAAEQ